MARLTKAQQAELLKQQKLLKQQNELFEFTQSYKSKLEDVFYMLRSINQFEQGNAYYENTLIPILSLDEFKEPQFTVIVPFSFQREWTFPLYGDKFDWETMHKFLTFFDELTDHINVHLEKQKKEQELAKLKAKLQESFTSEELKLLNINV